MLSDAQMTTTAIAGANEHDNQRKVILNKTADFSIFPLIFKNYLQLLILFFFRVYLDP